MKTRIIAAAVLIPVLLVLVLFAPKMFAAVILAALMSIGAYELLYRTHLVKHPRLVVYACVMAFAVTMWSHAGAVHAWLLIGMLVYTLVLFSEMMMDHVKVRIEMIALCYMAGAIVPFLLSALIRILAMTTGRYVILVPFVVAFMSDGGAYFAGLKFGKHKLAPVVSPNKTIEGLLGGLAAGMTGMVLYAIILRLMRFDVNFGVALLYGIVGSLAGTFGDLCFSIIKRQTGIKDYGNLIPGHGGALDRFDSLMVVAPLMEALLLVLPVVNV